MVIRTGFDIVFEYAAPTPVLAMLYTHPSREASIRGSDVLVVEPEVRVSDYTDTFGNRCARLIAEAGTMRFRSDGLIEDSGEPDPQVLEAEQHEIFELPDDALRFLLRSRYCEVDRILVIAWQLFGEAPSGGARVQAVCDFVHQHIRFDYLQARSTRTTYEAYQ